ncbi:KilA-N domain-containing protein [Pseudooceanicola marinus]|uniref:KilA-N domain-containing protein n=1 Tax=Pseudooceanicola marinus TaxID=396013 RepID=UPI001CD329A9|nr:KilA-N domain-containing protein [Pseudooceanicola marinus]MCA1337343.1 KilA-N domain-containing protein [Pseudooceanicola marinus]
MTQYALKLIEHEVQGSPVQQRAKDGYINATAMCRVAGKMWADYARLSSTKAFLSAAEADMGIPISELVKAAKGGEPRLQGTWVHPQVAIHLAQWLSPEFALKVSKWVFDWLSGRHAQTGYSYHLRRYTSNMQAVPYGHWSMLQEMMVQLIGPMESRGYQMPENMLPDISEGRMFCKFLRDSLNVDTDSLPTYRHEFEDGRVVHPKAYPNSLLPPFRAHFFEVWIPNRAASYFQAKDPVALEYLPYLLPKPGAA